MKNLKIINCIILIAFLCSQVGYAGNLPDGWDWQAGSGSVTINGKVMNISQLSDRAIINWISYCIARGYTVNYMQPGGHAICLNRVIGGSISEIFGSLNANGEANAQLNVPPVPQLVGVSFFAAYVVFNTGGINYISNSLNLGIHQ